MRFFACIHVKNSVSTSHGQVRWDISKSTNKCLHLLPKITEDKDEGQVAFQIDFVWTKDIIKAKGTSDNEVTGCQDSLVNSWSSVVAYRTHSRPKYLSNSSQRLYNYNKESYVKLVKHYPKAR